MKNQLLFGAIACGVAVFASSLMSVSVYAYTIDGIDYTNYSCDQPSLNTLSSVSIGDNVTNTIDCLYVDPATNNLNDTGSGAPLHDIQNIGNFFGHNDWTLHQPYFDFESLNVSTGTWDLDTLGTDGWWRSYEHIMLTFKDGNNTSTLVSYLYDMTKDGSFSMTSNVWEELYGGSKDISHIGIYTRGVPTPAVVLPMLGGLFGAAVRRQKMT